MTCRCFDPQNTSCELVHHTLGEITGMRKELAEAGVDFESVAAKLAANRV